MNAVIASALLVHGLAHLVGFVGPWRLMDVEGVTFQSALFDGRLPVGERTMRVLGVGWLLLAVAFVGTAIAGMVGAPWWLDLAKALAIASLLMSAANWPAARFGVWVNLGLLLILTLN